MTIDIRKTIDQLDPLAAITLATRLAATEGGVTGRTALQDVFNLLVAPVLLDLSGIIVSTSTGDAYSVTSARAPAALTDGFTIAFRADHDNAGASTLNVSGTGDKPWKREAGADFAPGDVVADAIFRATYVLATDEWLSPAGATKADVTAAVTAVVGGAPGALDTLKELADALADDANYATTITNALALKAPLASPAFTGNPTAPTQTAGDNSTKLANTAFVAAAILGVTSSASALSSVKGVSGTPNATTPTTKIDWSCNGAVLRDPASGVARIITFPATLTCDIGANAVNGRDQAGAFGASSWVHFYYTWEGGVLCTRASANTPSAGGPVVVSGTQWAYLGAWRINSSGNLVDAYQRGATHYYAAEQTAVNAGGATTTTAIGVAAWVPPNAISFQVLAEQLSVTSSSGGVAGARLNVGSKSTSVTAIIARLLLQGVLASGGVTVGGNSAWLANVSQQFFYFIDSVTGTSPSANIIIPAFRVPNGDA